MHTAKKTVSIGYLLPVRLVTCVLVMAVRLCWQLDQIAVGCLALLLFRAMCLWRWVTGLPGVTAGDTEPLSCFRSWFAVLPVPIPSLSWLWSQAFLHPQSSSRVQRSTQQMFPASTRGHVRQDGGDQLDHPAVPFCVPEPTVDVFLWHVLSYS